MGQEKRLGRRTWNSVGFLAVTVTVLLTLVSAWYMVRTPSDNLPFNAIITMVFDITGMCVCIILLLTALFDHRMNMATVYFIALIMLDGLLLFWEFMTWELDGDPEHVLLNKMVNYYVYGFILFILMTYWLYLRQILPIDEDYDRANNAYLFFFLVGMVFIATNPFTDALFTVDPETGAYERGDLFWVNYIGPVGMMILNAYVAYLYCEPARQKVAVVSYALLPMVAAIAQLFTYGIGLTCISLVIATLLMYGNFYVERGHELSSKSAELMEQNVTMLLSQIQPYFLYTSIKSIARIEGNPPETKEALKDFGKYLKGNLNTITQTAPIRFSKEMEHVQTYVGLEKMRFKEKLRIEYNIQSSDFDIPALTLQMLVENAIKHGITIRENGGTVNVLTFDDADNHVIIVSDNGVGFDTSAPPADDSRSHVGIINIRQRLKEMVDGTLEIDSEIGKGTVATIRIPKNHGTI